MNIFVVVNSTKVHLSGCFLNTYNPCEDINALPAQKWTCKYCDTTDGCNSAGKSLASIGILLITYMFSKIY